MAWWVIDLLFKPETEEEFKERVKKRRERCIKNMEAEDLKHKEFVKKMEDRRQAEKASFQKKLDGYVDENLKVVESRFKDQVLKAVDSNTIPKVTFECKSIYKDSTSPYYDPQFEFPRVVINNNTYNIRDSENQICSRYLEGVKRIVSENFKSAKIAGEVNGWYVIYSY